MTFRGISYYNFIKYFIINIVIKLIPILLIIKIPIKFNIIDIYFSIYLILLYIFIMSIINKNPYNYYKMMINTYLRDDNKYKSIFSKTYDFIYSKINKR
jgi:hypothetical protein